MLRANKALYLKISFLYCFLMIAAFVLTMLIFDFNTFIKSGFFSMVNSTMSLIAYIIYVVLLQFLTIPFGLVIYKVAFEQQEGKMISFKLVAEWILGNGLKTSLF